MTTTTTTLDAGEIAAILDKYDRLVRANSDETWDALAVVAACNDGLYGAFGELLDVARPWLDIRHADEWDHLSFIHLSTALSRYQRDLAVEVGPDRLDAGRTAGRFE